MSASFYPSLRKGPQSYRQRSWFLFLGLRNLFRHSPNNILKMLKPLSISLFTSQIKNNQVLQYKNCQHFAISVTRFMVGEVRVVASRYAKNRVPPSWLKLIRTTWTLSYSMTNPTFTHPSVSLPDAVRNSTTLSVQSHPASPIKVSNPNFFAKKSHELLQMSNAMVGILTSINRRWIIELNSNISRARRHQFELFLRI